MPFDVVSGDAAPGWRLKRREAILAAASTLFAQRSYAAVQMDEVARLAGVGKATLYRYFPSKEDLYLESLARALDELEGRMSVLAPAGSDPRSRLRAWVSALIDIFGEQLPTLKIIGGHQSELAEQGRRLIRHRNAHMAAVLRTVLEDGIAAGQFRALDTDITPTLIIGMVRGGVMGLGERPREQLERAVLDFVTAGTAITDTITTDTITLVARAETLPDRGHRAGSST